MTSEAQMNWEEVVQKIENGISKAEISRQMGLTRGQFRYRLGKFLENQQNSVQAETASTIDLLPSPETHRFQDHSLWDESWTRRWNQNRLVLMAREPTTLFAYWEIQEIRKKLICEHFESPWNDLPFFIQLYDVTHLWFDGYHANAIFRYQVHPEDDHWYFHSLTPGRKYVAIWGTATFRDQFFALLQSNVIELPRKEEPSQNHTSVCFRTLHSVSHLSSALLTPFSKLRSSNLEVPYWNPQFDGYTLRTKENE